MKQTVYIVLDADGVFQDAFVHAIDAQTFVDQHGPPDDYGYGLYVKSITPKTELLPLFIGDRVMVKGKPNQVGTIKSFAGYGHENMKLWYVVFDNESSEIYGSKALDRLDANKIPAPLSQ